MPTLRDIQEQFARHLQGLPTSPDIAAQVKFNQLQNNQRLQVYQNNFKLSLVSSLAAVYPVIRKLVGEEFFDYAAKNFIQNTPSKHGNLHEYGSEFGLFLAEFEPAKQLTYLPDMARFEWAYHRVFHELETNPFDLQRLQDVDEQDYGYIVFSLNPASRLIASNYPLVEIWQANQSDNPPEIKLEAKKYFFLIGRRKFENVFQSLDEVEYQFLNLIKDSKMLGEISTALIDMFPDQQIDLNQLLVKNVTLNNISDFKLVRTSKDDECLIK